MDLIQILSRCFELNSCMPFFLQGKVASFSSVCNISMEFIFILFCDARLGEFIFEKVWLWGFGGEFFLNTNEVGFEMLMENLEYSAGAIEMNPSCLLEIRTKIFEKKNPQKSSSQINF